MKYFHMEGSALNQIKPHNLSIRAKKIMYNQMNSTNI